jgi:hypothetical protein
MTSTATISPEYLRLQTALHENPDYGVVGVALARPVAVLMRNTGAKSLADYGAGKQSLLAGLNKLGVAGFEYYPYDPVFPEYGPAREADVVCCIDVLEHIEPDRIEAVIAELAAITRRHAFFSISLGPAAKVLADGRNAHLIQQPTSWWLERLIPYFEVLDLSTLPGESKSLILVLERRRDPQARQP